MNQILETKKNRNKIIKALRVQLIMSIVGIFCVCAFFYSSETNNSYNENFSKILALNAELSSMYQVENTNYSNIFGRIEIPKIGLEYIVFNQFNEELLKISPCKFYGGSLNENRQYCYCRSQL